MTTDDLSMVNLHRTGGGGWSWTAYRKPHELWRTNKGVADFWMCFEELQSCLEEETAKERAAQIPEPDRDVFGPELNPNASGGMSGKLAVKWRKKTRQKPTAITPIPYRR